MLDQLEADLSEFVSRLNSSEDIEAKQKQPGILLTESYKRLLRIMRDFWLFGSAVQFWLHPYFHHVLDLDELSLAQRRMVKIKGGEWPPPAEGMLCFAGYFRDADSDQVLFDISKGHINNEYPVMCYSHEILPAWIEKFSDSLNQWLNKKYINEMTEAVDAL